MSTGECACYEDDVNGHYSGTVCQSCASGYIGEKCLTLNAEIVRVDRNTSALVWAKSVVEVLRAETKLWPPYAINLSNPLFSPRPRVLVVDPLQQRLYVGGVPVIRYNFTVRGNLIEKVTTMDPNVVASSLTSIKPRYCPQTCHPMLERPRMSGSETLRCSS